MDKKRIRFATLKNFLQLNFKEQTFFFEAFYYLAFSRSMLVIYPFKKIATELGTKMIESSTSVHEKDIETARSAGRSIRRASSYTPFRSLCFEQAIALKYILNKRKISSTIYLGVSKNAKDGKLEAHAWTRVGNIYPTGFKGKENFTVISTFSAKQ